MKEQNKTSDGAVTANTTKQVNPTTMKTKVCAHCQVEATTLYRIQTPAEGKSWIFVCEGCCIRAKIRPGYRYGGTWQGYRH